MKPRPWLLAAGLLSLSARAEPAAAPPASPSAPAVSNCDPFAESGAWTMANPAAWTWSGEGSDRVLHLLAQSGRTPKYRSPFNLAWYEAREWKDFTLTGEMRLTKFDAGNNDLCVAFGRSSENRFYYAHLGEKADAVHHQLHLVDEADRRAITATRTEGTPWKEGTWHKVRVVRDTATGNIAVFFDDMEKPVLTARDKTLADWGRIGLGSFDDLGEFRHVRVEGTSRPAPGAAKKP